MRVTDSMHYDLIASSSGKLEQRLLDASQEASTGLKLNAPEDDPAGAATLVRLGSSEDRTTAYRSSIDRVKGDAALSESTLASATSILDRAREIAMQGSSGALSASDRQALATETSQLVGDMLSLANTKGEHGYLFAGSATKTQPFDAAGNFSANDDARSVEIAQGVSVVENTSGAKTFTAAGGVDVFATLKTLQTALAANDSAGVAATVKDLDTSHGQIVAAQSDAGLLLSRLDSTDATHQQTLTLIATSKHDLADADLPSAYSALTAAQNSLTQSIAVGKQVMSTLNAWFA